MNRNVIIFIIILLATNRGLGQYKIATPIIIPTPKEMKILSTDSIIFQDIVYSTDDAKVVGILNTLN